MNKKSKFSINSFYNELDQVLSIPNSVFISDNDTDQKFYNLILSFTHFFNNLRDVSLISQLIISNLQNTKKTNSPEFGQFGGMKIFADNLFFAFIFEFIQILKYRDTKKIIESDEFKKIISTINKNSQVSCKELLKIVYHSNDRIYGTLLKLRNNLSFHYYQPKKLFEGYDLAAQNAENKMYVSLGSKMSQTRYYFYDLANQIAIYQIINENGFSISDWKREIENLVNLILSFTMNITHRFITLNCAPSKAKDEKIPSIKSYLSFLN